MLILLLLSYCPGPGDDDSFLKCLGNVRFVLETIWLPTLMPKENLGDIWLVFT